MTTALFVCLAAVAIAVPMWRLRVRSVDGTVVAAIVTLLAGGVASLAILDAIEGFWAPAAGANASQPLIAAETGYVGSAACRSCHPGEHASWHSSFHRTMTQVATRDTIVDRFARRELDWFGKPVVLEWRDETLWVDFHRGGNDPRHVERPIAQTTGSHHFQVLWYSTGNERELAPVPMCFKLEERIWIPLTTVFVLPPEFRDPPEPGAWNRNCHMCHATAVRPRVDIGRCDTHVTELGIACEACHGPGGDHVAANRNPLRRYALHADGESDATVVDPSRLPRPRAAQVCGQCHSVNILRHRHHEAWREHGLVYRPGDELRASNLIIDPTTRDAPELHGTLQHNPEFFASAFWSDGQVRLSGREYNGLVKSPCFTHGEGARQLDCTSCHDMHDETGQQGAWRDDQLAVGMRGNAACTQCHAEYVGDENLAAHTHHAPGSTGSTCYDCHMSHTSFGLMKAMRSHTITSPSVAAELATGRPNACNQCHLDRTLAWTNAALQRNWGIAPVALDDDQRDVAASVRWLLSGDAGQRVLAAWSMGWAPAQQAAGSDWLWPYLARLLDDPYYVVRFNAARSLRSLGATADLDTYDFLAEADAAREFGKTLHASWQQSYAGGARSSLLIDEGATLTPAFARLYARRDDRPVYLAE